jgi:hypothetical protein
MFRLFNRNLYAFSNKAYDLAIIGGGPGGTKYITQVMLLQSRQLNSA